MKKRFVFLGLISIILGLLIISKTRAATVVSPENKNETIKISKNEIIDDNLIIFAQDLTIDGTVKGDVIGAVLDTVTINGVVEGDLIVVAPNIKINGRVARNVFSVSQGLIIDGVVNGEVSAANQETQITANAVLEKNLNLMTQKADLSEQAKINGEQKITISQQKTVRPWQKFNQLFLSFFSLIFTGIVLLRLFPKFFEASGVFAIDHWGLSFLWGIILLIIVPIASGVLLLTRIGSPIALLILGVYFLAFYLSTIVVGLGIGKKLLKKTHLLGQMVFGVLLIFLVKSIPGLNGLVAFLVLIIGLGALVLAKKQSFKI